MKKVLCKNCKHYNKKSKEMTNEYGYIKICNHPSCFAEETKYDCVNGDQIIRKRISGQTQLNKKYDCKYFKPKFRIF